MKRLISLAISLVILFFIYNQIDLKELVNTLRHCNILLLLISVGIIVPIISLTAWRLQKLVAKNKLTVKEANKLVLTAATLNIVLPSKMGDIAKAYFLIQRGYLGKSLAVSLVVFEKLCDLTGLLFWGVIGLMLYPENNYFLEIMTRLITVTLLITVLILFSSKFSNICLFLLIQISPNKFYYQLKNLQIGWDNMYKYMWHNKTLFLKIIFLSIFISFLYMLQMWFFILALQSRIPFVINLALSPLAFLAGLFPLTFVGIGTRDAALFFLYQPYFDQPTIAALGILCTLRYLLPAMGGLPFLYEFLNANHNLRY
jgi:hypothetical protein